MREISAVKQKILILGLVGILILAIAMIVIMFMGEKNNQEQIVDNSTTADKTTNEQSLNQQVTKANETKAEQNKRFLKIASENVFGLKIQKGTNRIMFYQNQKILSADPFSGKKHSLGSYPFTEVTKFLWSHDSSKALVKDSGSYYIYRANSNLANKFPLSIDIAIWDGKKDRLIYKYYNSNTGERSIASINSDGKDKILIKKGIPYRKIELTVRPGTDSVCYFPHPDARLKGKLFCQSLNGQIKKEYGGHYGQDYLWSPDGSKILTSFTKEESGNKITLGVIDKNNNQEKELSLGTTVQKCVWSKNNIDVYCAALNGAPLAIMMPNAWEEELFNSADTFWKINTETGEKKRLVELDKMSLVVDSENLILDAEEKFLFFVGRRGRNLWRLKL